MEKQNKLKKKQQPLTIYKIKGDILPYHQHIT